MDGFVKLGPEAQKKVDDLFDEMMRERLKVVLKAFGIMIPLGFLTAVVTVFENMQRTPFPMVVGLATWVAMNVTYILPAEKEIGEHYGEEIKKVVKDERSRQAEESRLAGSDSREGG